MKRKALGLAILLLIFELAMILTVVRREPPRQLAQGGAPLPVFTLPRLDANAPPFSSRELVHGVMVINIFAPWCGPCQAEQPELMRLARAGVDIVGISYLDTPAAARKYLKRFGNPYRDVADDEDGHLEQVMGIDAVPRTFVINSQGNIVYEHDGRLLPGDVDNVILPLIHRLETKPSSGDV